MTCAGTPGTRLTCTEKVWPDRDGPDRLAVLIRTDLPDDRLAVQLDAALDELGVPA